METEYLENVKTFLGTEENRYFSEGFKFMNYKFDNVKYINSFLFGNIGVKNTWRKSQKRHLHLGTIEYIAITYDVCESLLYNDFNLTETAIASSWIRDFKIKITKCTNLIDFRAIPFSAKIESTIKERNSELYISSIVLNISNTRIYVNVVHPVLDSNVISSSRNLNLEDIYVNDNYKLRDHDIKDVVISTDIFSCIANIISNNDGRNRKGLEGNYNGSMISDIIKISGQLMEVLYYKLYPKESHNRKENIWLREFSFSNRKCSQSKDFITKIMFNKIVDIVKRGETWKSIQFLSKVGDTCSLIKVVTKITKKQERANEFDLSLN